MKPYQRVQKSTSPTLDVKSSGGLEFQVSDETKEALRTIESQMDAPDLTDVVPAEIDEKNTLDPIFKDYANPPELVNASISARKRIESGLAPIEIDSLFISGEITQRVAIIPNNFIF